MLLVTVKLPRDFDPDSPIVTDVLSSTVCDVLWDGVGVKVKLSDFGPTERLRLRTRVADEVCFCDVMVMLGVLDSAVIECDLLDEEVRLSDALPALSDNVGLMKDDVPETDAVCDADVRV